MLINYKSDIEFKTTVNYKLSHEVTKKAGVSTHAARKYSKDTTSVVGGGQARVSSATQNRRRPARRRHYCLREDFVINSWRRSLSFTT